jgi:arylsulfatase A-like enzyme
MAADVEGMKALGIQPDSIIGVHVSQCGFEPYERDDGLHPSSLPRPRYDAYLLEKGFEAENPWEHWANSGEAADGALQNGCLMVHADKTARIPEEHSETPYMTRRAMDFIGEAEQDGRPWCLHLSYIKPHWPYIAPEPSASMYGEGDVQPVIRSDRERQNPHPVFGAFMDMRYSRNFSRDGAREKVIPTYMGLIKQIDDQLGVLFGFLEARGLMSSTMIVFTSDHGDYLGDHWMGEKDLFHEPSVKIPLIVCDPSPAAEGARGSVCDELVESIDLIPTFLEALGADPHEQSHRLEGRSLMGIINGAPPAQWRRFAISEYDYALQPFAAKLGILPRDAQLFMVADKRWKLVHAPQFRPMLYDLESDPNELRDLGADPAFEGERQRLMSVLNAWGLRLSQRTTRSEAQMLAARGKSQRKGILIGVWDEKELPEELWDGYLGRDT